MVKIQSRIEDAIKMIRNSKITLREFKRKDLMTEDEGTTLFLQVKDRIPIGEGPKYTDIGIPVIDPLFSIVDSIVNEQLPSKRKSDFKAKQNSLPESTIDEKIFKECYRILRLMRNYSIHSSLSILVSDQGFIQFNNSSEDLIEDPKIKITEEGFDYLATYVVAYASDKDKKYSEKHRSEILKSYYTEFRKGLRAFDDGDSKHPLMTIEEIEAYFKITVRYYVENPSYEFKNLAKKILITSGLPDESDYDEYSRDYLISGKYFKNKKYLVPHEDLDSDNKISVKDMEEYLID